MTIYIITVQSQTFRSFVHELRTSRTCFNYHYANYTKLTFAISRIRMTVKGLGLSNSQFLDFSQKSYVISLTRNIKPAWSDIGETVVYRIRFYSTLNHTVDIIQPVQHGLYTTWR